MDDETPITESINDETPAPEVLEAENNSEQDLGEPVAPAPEDSIVEDFSAPEDSIAEDLNVEEVADPEGEGEGEVEEHEEPEILAPEEDESIVEDEHSIVESVTVEETDPLSEEEGVEEIDGPDESALMHTDAELEEEGQNEEIGDETLDHSLVDESREEQPEYLSDAEDQDTPRPTQVLDDEADEQESASRRQSASSQRRTSLRTEALIQATAREVVAKIEADARARVSARYSEDPDTSILSSTTHESYGIDGTEMTYDEDHSDASRRESCRSTGSQIHHDVAAHSVSGESSSHPEPDDDDDVFSDHSPRSSLGSADGPIDAAYKMPPEDHTPSPKPPRVSDISGISQYEREDFVPTSRDTPRVPFRTPTAVRALQMSSPTPSVYSGGTPRSSKRHTGGFVTISRLGSPTASAQYSPKGRSTPPRFKAREAPLVLLHVTLMPLRWMWGDVLSGLDTVNCGTSDGKKRFEPSDELKTLRGAWRQLQDRIGDTVLERGILLPHPQNDYEILEERLLEALELPLRRRARILECGHYLGPAEDDEVEYEESDDDDDDTYGRSPRDRALEKRHWCNTCRGEIRYEDLGPGKTFRVKVYASNGLMKAGAWGACWKEMERVDVELEPVVETALHAELERLAAVLAEAEEEQQRELEREEERQLLQQQLAQEQDHAAEGELPPVVQSSELCRTGHGERNLSPAPSSPHPHPPSTMRITMHASPLEPLTSSPARVLSPPAARHTSPIDLSEERRFRDEERLREIYGHTPPRTHPEVDETPSSPHTTARQSSALPPHPDSYIPPPSPRSPSEEAFDRRSGRRSDDDHHQPHHPRPYQSASLQELLLESARVLLRDRRNVAIALLSFFVLIMAMRPSHAPPPLPLQQPQDSIVADKHAYHFESDAEPTLVAEMATAASEAVKADNVVQSKIAEVVAPEPSTEVATGIPCESIPSSPAEPTIRESEVVRVRETVTETVRVSVTVSELPEPETQTEAAVQSEASKHTVYETQTETVRVTESVDAEPSAETEVGLEAHDDAESPMAEPEQLEAEFEAPEAATL